MMGVIGFDNYRILCILGVLPKEREEAQDIFVDLQVEIDFSISSKTDHLEDTVDYTALAQLCTSLAEENQYMLLEAYAADVLKQIFIQFTSAYSAWIKVKKPLGLASAAYTMVELKQKREDLLHLLEV